MRITTQEVSVISAKCKLLHALPRSCRSRRFAAQQKAAECMRPAQRDHTSQPSKTHKAMRLLNKGFEHYQHLFGKPQTRARKPKRRKPTQTPASGGLVWEVPCGFSVEGEWRLVRGPTHSHGGDQDPRGLCFWHPIWCHSRGGPIHVWGDSFICSIHAHVF